MSQCEADLSVDEKQVVDQGVQDLLTSLVARLGLQGSLPEDKELKACYSVLKNVQDRMGTILSQRNDSAAIHKLPEELLSTIFHLSLPYLNDTTIYYEDQLAQYYWRLESLQLVCRLWANQIRHDTSFWCLVSTRYAHPMLQMILDRSGETPLTIEAAPEASAIEEERLRKDIVPLFSRAVSLYLRISRTSLSLCLACLALASPSIKRLTLLWHYSDQLLVQTLFPSLVPNLNSVVLLGVSEVRPLPWLTSLRCLVLKSATVTIYALLTILQDCAALQKLELESPCRPDGEDVPLPMLVKDAEYRIPLLHLDELNIDAPPTYVEGLVGSILAPMCVSTRIILRIYADNGLVLPMESTSEQITAQFRPHLYGFMLGLWHPQWLSLNFHSEGFAVEGQLETTFVLSYTGPSDSRQRRLKDHQEMLCDLPHSLRLSVTSFSVDLLVFRRPTLLTSVNAYFPNINTLVVPTTWANRQHGFTQLCRPVDGVWLLPELDTIEIRDPAWRSQVPIEPSTYVRLLRILVNAVKARNVGRKGAETCFFESRVDGVAAVRNILVEMDVVPKGKGEALLEELKRYVYHVQIEPRKALPELPWILGH